MLATIPLEDTHLGIHWNHKDFCIDSSYNVFLLNHQQTNSLFSFLYTRKKVNLYANYFSKNLESSVQITDMRLECG